MLMVNKDYQCNEQCLQVHASAGRPRMDGQHQYVDRTLRGRVNQNDRGQK